MSHLCPFYSDNWLLIPQTTEQLLVKSISEVFFIDRTDKIYSDISLNPPLEMAKMDFTKFPFTPFHSSTPFIPIHTIPSHVHTQVWVLCPFLWDSHRVISIPIPIYGFSHSFQFPFPNLSLIPIPTGFPWKLGIPCLWPSLPSPNFYMVKMRNLASASTPDALVSKASSP